MAKLRGRAKQEAPSMFMEVLVRGNTFGKQKSGQRLKKRFLLKLNKVSHNKEEQINKINQIY